MSEITVAGRASSARDRAVGELRTALHGVLAATRRLRGRDAKDARGLTFPQYRLLLSLARADELSAGELAASAELAPATVTQMLDQLVAAGIVERARSADDRRRVLNRLTPAGRALQEAKHADLTLKWEAAFDDVDEDDLRVGLELLGRIRRFLDDA